MSNISQIKKVAYTITATDVANFNATVPVLWNSPFSDTHYVVSVSVESTKVQHTSKPNASSNFPIGIANLTTTGFTAAVGFSGTPTAGDTFTLHCMASRR